MGWVSITEADLRDAMATDLRPVYDQWVVDHPEKADRLAEILADTVAAFRQAIANNPENTLDPDQTKVPQACVIDVETIIFYTLAMEMGVSLKPEANQSVTQARIQLRQIGYGHFATAGTDKTESPSPLYSTPSERAGQQDSAERTLP